MGRATQVRRTSESTLEASAKWLRYPETRAQLPAPLPDGRMLHSSKPHSSEKLFYWSRVLQEFARLTKKSWAGKRVCIDLFAGCGIYRDIETHELGWGSPLLALHAIDPFDVYIFGDRKPKRAEALTARVEDTNLAAHVSQLHLDDPDLMHAVADFKALQVHGRKVAVSSAAMRTGPCRL